MADSGFRRILEPHLLGEESLARAWEASTDLERAWAKSLLAALFEEHPPGPVTEERRSWWRLGPEYSRTCSQPRAVVVYTDERFDSPARLLATVMPALAAAPGRVFLVRNGPWPPSMLTALELAGVEQICAIDATKITGFMEAMAAEDDVYLASLGPAPADSPLVPVWTSGSAKPGIGVFDPGDEVDIHALAWAHPDIEPDFHRGKWRDFLGGGFHAAIVPADLVSEAAAAFTLVLSPGLEHFWFWPGLGRQTFLTCSASVSLGGQG
jgi:hypothetical protein